MTYSCRAATATSQTQSFHLYVRRLSSYISHQKEKSRAIPTQVLDAQPHFYTKTYQRLQTKSGLVTFFFIFHVLQWINIFQFNLWREEKNIYIYVLLSSTRETKTQVELITLFKMYYFAGMRSHIYDK